MYDAISLAACSKAQEMAARLLIEKGYIWVKYSCYYYDENNALVTASEEIDSRLGN